MKFKVGDRVILVKNYSYLPNIGMKGTVVGFYKSKIENSYKIDWDEDGQDEAFDTFEGELELITPLSELL